MNEINDEIEDIKMRKKFVKEVNRFFPSNPYKQVSLVAALLFIAKEEEREEEREKKELLEELNNNKNNAYKIIEKKVMKNSRNYDLEIETYLKEILKTNNRALILQKKKEMIETVEKDILKYNKKSQKNLKMAKYFLVASILGVKK